MKRKLVGFNDDVLRACEQYGRDHNVTLDETVDVAVRDLLKKKGQPVTLHEALKQSVKMVAANDGGRKYKGRKVATRRDKPLS